MPGEEIRHLRVLISNEKRERPELPTGLRGDRSVPRTYEPVPSSFLSQARMRAIMARVYAKAAHEPEQARAALATSARPDHQAQLVQLHPLGWAEHNSQRELV